MEFSELPIPEPVQAGIRDCGFSTCTAIQELTLPLTLSGRDVAGQAQTGTGKTAAFMLATLSRLVGDTTLEALKEKSEAEKNNPNPKNTGVSRPRALLIAPTRELVVQIEQDARSLGIHTGLKVLAVYGGVDYEKQRETLIKDNVDILIGTPGRLIDYFKQKSYLVSRVEVFVIDEADRMFDMGFIADLRYLMRRLPHYEQRLSMLFSATLSHRSQELSYEYMNNPEMISTKTEFKTVNLVTQSLYHVEGDKKISLLVGLIRKNMGVPLPAPAGEEQPDLSVVVGRGILFVNTKRMGEKLQNWLLVNGIPTGYLSGDVPQAKRMKVLSRFQKGEVPILIATDVAGRGLHIDDVTHVYNYDLPENAEDYVHRIGRTARAGAKGDAITLVDENGAYNLEAIETYIGAKIDVEWAEDDLYVELIKPPRSPYQEKSTGRPPRGGRRDRPRRDNR
ncbi:MAG: DEAD/DEAH box helicase [Magnetococcales bacterium]|nr:DEAD/DEAH box helicase [Magnetococcales bacterium]